MDRTLVRKYQLAQLKLLEYFDQLCADLGLHYYLVFGTLLGAVRHQGFIPWDADIDVAMFRDDYEKVRRYFHEHPNEDLYYQHYETEKNHISPHAVLKIKGTHVYSKNNSLRKYSPKHDGIYIDIFPIDNVLEDEKKQSAQVKRIFTIRRIVSYKVALAYGDRTSKPKKMMKKLVSGVLSPISFRSLFKHADKVMKRYDSTPLTEHVAILTDPQVFHKQLFTRDVFGTPRRMVFENKEFSVPEKAEEFLSVRYGEYMTLPPESERWSYLDNALESVDFGSTSFLQGLDG